MTILSALADPTNAMEASAVKAIRILRIGLSKWFRRKNAVEAYGVPHPVSEFSEQAFRFQGTRSSRGFLAMRIRQQDTDIFLVTTVMVICLGLGAVFDYFTPTTTVLADNQPQIEKVRTVGPVFVPNVDPSKR